MGITSLNIYKPIAKTPLQVIQQLEATSPKLKDKKIAYAGRLDPMAHGVLLLLVEPETKNRTKYQNLDKEYEFEILFDITTDTYDLMGLPIRARTVPTRSSHKNISKDKLDRVILTFLRISELPYPPYSSKTVNGKPLYWYARREKLNSIKIPTKKIKIYDLSLKKLHKISTKELKNKVNLIRKVKGDFRQEKILKAWYKLFDRYPSQNYQVAKFTIHCTSGTYIRTIAHKMGKELGTGALALDIQRTAVGKYKLEDSKDSIVL